MARPARRPAPALAPGARHVRVDLAAPALRGGPGLVVDDTAAEPAFAASGGPAALTGGGVRACVLVPLAAGTDLYGLLTVARAQVHLWSEAETALVDAVARDLGRALQHGHLFEQQRLLVEQLRELDRTKTDFLSTVSHELRTPLTSISGYVELLRDEDAGRSPPSSRACSTSSSAHRPAPRPDRGPADALGNRGQGVASRRLPCACATWSSRRPRRCAPRWPRPD
ncbi:MAG: GAF domain-containing protein [Actinomycetota bacterium]|nr:GAF domain-containing protein [Actinomycetota bacterium]